MFKPQLSDIFYKSISDSFKHSRFFPWSMEIRKTYMSNGGWNCWHHQLVFLFFVGCWSLLVPASFPPTVMVEDPFTGPYDLSTLPRGWGELPASNSDKWRLHIYFLPNYTYPQNQWTLRKRGVWICIEGTYSIYLYIVCCGKRLGGHGSWMVVVVEHSSINCYTYMTYICMKCIKLCKCCMIPYYQTNRTTTQL